MPIISKVEGRSFKGRLLYAALFAVLSIGGLTMIYPFALMVSGSLRSEMDETDLDLIPSFLVNEVTLYRKFLETKYNQNVMLLNRSHLQQNFTFRTAEVPERLNEAQARELRGFMVADDFPQHWQVLGGTLGVRTRPENLRMLQDRLARKFNNDLNAFGEAMGAQVSSWSVINFVPPDWVSQRFDAPHGPVFMVYEAMAREAPPAEIALVSLSGYFLETMVYPIYGQREAGLENYNAAHVEPLGDFSLFRLPSTVPERDPVLREEWIDFATNELNASFIATRGVPNEDYRQFLSERYGEIGQLNETWGGQYGAFDDILLPRDRWLPGAERQDYRDFLLTLPPEAWELSGPEYAWRQHLLEIHGSLDAINTALNTNYSEIEEIFPPIAQLEFEHVSANTGGLRWTYSVRNYINVFDELFLRGRAFINTVIYCFLAVVSALLVNPMAAYAMSRMRLPGTYKVLMILMATIAFPPMVTTIPQFILLREANLLNTFLALVLPAIANGYLVFLLKGFFDSLPGDLYEAATIDGASEIRIFFQITMSLSKPILAVVALGAFNGAYGAFLYPLIVAPSQDMWVLNVWLYQWQQTASTSAMFASVLIASIPTLLVFLVAQNIIMRGIVVPTEK